MLAWHDEREQYAKERMIIAGRVRLLRAAQKQLETEDPEVIRHRLRQNVIHIEGDLETGIVKKLECYKAKRKKPELIKESDSSLDRFMEGHGLE